LTKRRAIPSPTTS